MPYELSEIKLIRKKLNLTQTELAKAANVSQSLIAKIESDRIDPAFTNVKKIFDTLNALQKKGELKAKDFMQTKIIHCTPNEMLKDVIEKMKKYEISQLPVLEHDNIIGLVSESIILNSFLQKDAHILKVKDIMQEAPPIISSNASEIVITNLLKHYPIIIIKDKGKIQGLITKADVIRKLYK